MKKSYATIVTGCLSAFLLLSAPLAANLHLVKPPKNPKRPASEQGPGGRQQDRQGREQGRRAQPGAEAQPWSSQQEAAEPALQGIEKEVLRTFPMIARMPLSLHVINSFNADRTLIELEDGSKWAMDPDEAREIFSWKEGDSVVLFLNYRMFTSYTYKIKNLQAQYDIMADLYSEPVVMGPYSHWIVDIDYPSRTLTLENGTSWFVSDSCEEDFSKWAVNDPVVVGLSFTRYTPYDYVFINAKIKNYVYSAQLEPSATPQG